MIMDYPYIKGEYSPDHAKKSRWNLFHEYIYVHDQRFIDEYTGDGLQSISILQSK